MFWIIPAVVSSLLSSKQGPDPLGFNLPVFGAISLSVCYTGRPIAQAYGMLKESSTGSNGSHGQVQQAVLQCTVGPAADFQHWLPSHQSPLAILIQMTAVVNTLHSYWNPESQQARNSAAEVPVEAACPPQLESHTAGISCLSKGFDSWKTLKHSAC